MTVEFGLIKVWSNKMSQNDTKDYVDLWNSINNWVSNSFQGISKVFAYFQFLINTTNDNSFQENIFVRCPDCLEF